MGFKDTFKKVVGIEEFDEDELEVDETEIERVKEELVKEDKEKAEKEKPATETPFIPAFNRDKTTKTEEKKNMTSQSNRKYSVGNTCSLKLIVIEPRGFEECKTLVDNLKDKKPIIVKLEHLETDLAKKIFDFLNGAVYALNGKVSKISNNIFLFAPDNVGIAESKNERPTPPSEQSPWG